MLWERIKDCKQRPLILKGKIKVQNIFDQRQKQYLCADYVINSETAINNNSETSLYTKYEVLKIIKV